jgi:hypothetical protein
MKRLALALGALTLLAVGAISQTVVQNQVSGNEVWQAAQGPGGPASWISISTVSGRSPKTTALPVSGNITLCTAAGTSAICDGGNMLITPAVTGTVIITLPANPFPDGGIMGICNVTGAPWAATSVTVIGNAGQTSPSAPGNTITTLAAQTCARYQFNLQNTTWYRIT